MKILFFDYRKSEEKYFEEHRFQDFEIKFFEQSLNEKTKLSEQELKETDIICVYRSSLLTSDVLKKFPNLRIVATRSLSFNHVDINYCLKNRIALIHAEQYGEEAIAEYTMGMIIALERKMKQAIIDINTNKVNPKIYEGKNLKNLSLGIIGCGKVGIYLAKLANNFGIKSMVSSYKEEPNFNKTCNVVPFDTLLSKSDIISLHMPFTTEMYQILGEEEFEKMKEGVIIVNTSCVDLMDIHALYKYLLSGKVKGAGLDILDSDFMKKSESKKIGNETLSSWENEKFSAKLLEMPNVIITPHISYNTVDTIDYVLDSIMNSIRDTIKGLSTNRIC